jgi:benzoate/toluate 1,2-dioxygenase reductase subunit
VQQGKRRGGDDLEGLNARQPVRLLGRTRLSERTIELALSRPQGFTFTPGQSVRFVVEGMERDYSIASGPAEPALSFLVALSGPASMPARLAALPIDSLFQIEGPHGYFVREPSDRPLVLVATGTGIAPFLSMVRAGLRGFTFLHGVSAAAELAYAEELRAAAKLYVPCLSRDPASGSFAGRVTAWTRGVLRPGAYDFYLCGRREMVRDMTIIADERFPGSRVRTEIFF